MTEPKLTEFVRGSKPGVVMWKAPNLNFPIRYRIHGAILQNGCQEHGWSPSSHPERLPIVRTAIGLFWPECVALPDRVFMVDNVPYRWERGSISGSVRRYWIDTDRRSWVGWQRFELTTSSWPGMKDALDYYWPEKPTTCTKEVEPFGDFKWVPAGEGCVQTLMPDVWYYRARRHPEGLEWQVNPLYDKNPTWDVNGIGLEVWVNGARAALHHFWPLTSTKEEPIAWQFRSTPDKVDVTRCLREAYDAGAREVTIVKDGTERTYLHQDERALVKSWFFQAPTSLRALSSWGDMVLTQVDQWFMVREPLLERARAWDDEQKAKAETKIVVKVKGVR